MFVNNGYSISYVEFSRSKYQPKPSLAVRMLKRSLKLPTTTYLPVPFKMPFIIIATTSVVNNTVKQPD
jgi:hypothetical protein